MAALRVRLLVGDFFSYAHSEIVFHPAGSVISVTPAQFSRRVADGTAVPVTDEDLAAEWR